MNTLNTDTASVIPDYTKHKLNGLHHLVGNTPLLAINFTLKGKKRRLFAKSENLNMTGSIKDRMALHILRRAYLSGAIKKGDPIVEATSGNTGISFAAIGRALGHPVTIFMPDWMSRERVDLITSLGATIKPVTRKQGGFLGSIKLTEEFAEQNENVFLPRQFSNESNVDAHYENTGVEIWWQLAFGSFKPDSFVAGVGTGGTIMGVGKRLKELNPNIKLHPVEPAESPTLSTGYKVGQHRIQGISDEFIPDIVDLKKTESVIAVHDGDAIIMAQKLAAQLGLAVGISSGANFLGAVMAQNYLGDDAIVATVFPDSNKKYLSTDLLRREQLRNGYLSPDIELTDFRAYKRVCHTCCDYEDCEQKIPIAGLNL